MRPRDWRHEDVRRRDWRHEVKQFCGISKNKRQDIQTLLISNAESTDQELANHIKEAFISAMKDYKPLENYVYVQHDDHESITINGGLIIKKLQQINTSKAGGADNIPNWVLKTFSDHHLQSPTSSIRQFMNVKFLSQGNWPM